MNIEKRGSGQEKKSVREKEELTIRLDRQKSLRDKVYFGPKGERLKTILEALEDENSQVCVEALKIGANVLSGEERLKIILTAFKNEDLQVRKTALEIGADILSEEKKLSEEERLKVIPTAFKDSVWTIRRKALTRGVIILSEKGKFKLLQMAIENEDPLLREEALFLSMIALQEEEKLKAIFQIALKDRDSRISDRAKRYLEILSRENIEKKINNY